MAVNVNRKTTAKKNSEHFPCFQCGAVLKYAPGTQTQVCAYCGFENHIENRVGKIQEYDLQQALQNLSVAAKAAKKQQIKCHECGAGFKFESSIRSGECPFCGTPIVITRTENKAIQPKSLLPFLLDEQAAHARFRDWLKNLWFAPNALKKHTHSATKLTGVYLPFWTFDSDTETDYSGERGDIYYVQQRVQVMRNNRLVTQTKRVAKIRWRPVNGRVQHFFDDVLIGASVSLPRKIVDQLQPWDLQKLIPYDEKYLSGFRSEYYQVELDKGFDHAKQVMDSRIYRAIAVNIGGDHQRIHQVQTRHRKTTYKHCLLPVWSAAFRYRKQAYHFVINGRSGEVQGERPYSVWKIACTGMTALLIASGIYYYLDATGALQSMQQY